MDYQYDDFLRTYKKIKNEIYHNKSNLYQLRSIANWESTNSSNDVSRTFMGSFIKRKDSKCYSFNKIEILFKNFSEKSKKSDDYFDSLISKIDVLLLPKKIHTPEAVNIINKNYNLVSDCSIAKAKYFIKLPVELHIIETLWLLNIGIRFEKKIDSSALGNRILLNCDGNSKENGPIFKPYHAQYKEWRDGGLKVAIKEHESGNSVDIINLDITDCFNSIKLNTSIFKFEYLDQYDQRLNKIFVDILKKYTTKISEYIKLETLENEFILPIGLFSSNTLCNYYLSKFDNEILKNVKPVFYTRYIDDISIVIINNKDDEIKNKNEYLSSLLKGIVKSDKKNLIYINDSNIIFNPEKTVLYKLSPKGSSGQIKKYLIETSKNSSEFRFVSDEYIELDRLIDSTNELNAKDNINKLRSIDTISTAKYGLSIFLSKSIQTVLNNGKIKEEIIEELLSIFTGANLFKLEALWEKIFTLLVLTDDRDNFLLLYERICEGIWEIKIDDHDNHSSIRANILDNLLICIELATSLNLQFMDKCRKRFEIISNKEYIHALFKDSGKYNFDIHYYNNFIPVFVASNMFRHNYLKTPLINYTNQNRNLFRSFIFDTKVENEVDLKRLILSPRSIKFYEIILFIINKKLFENNETYSVLSLDEYKLALKYYFLANKKLCNIYNHLDDLVNNDKNSEDFIDSILDIDFLESVYEQSIRVNIDNLSDDLCVQEISSYKQTNKLPKIAIANLRINERRIEENIRNANKTTQSNLKNILRILDDAEKIKSDFLLFPECSIEYENLFSLSKYIVNKSRVVIIGTEHTIIGDFIYNFITTLLPIEINGASDLIPVIRLKNNYSPKEVEVIEGHSFRVPRPEKITYHLFNWNNIYFSTYYCFELANISHRSIFKSKVDIVFASEWNKDVNYFSNIVESTTRDLHVYFVQSNTSQFGDSRMTKPAKTEMMNIMRIDGGISPTIIDDVLDIEKLRLFQLKNFSLQKEEKYTFKISPPDFNKKNVRKRISNKSFYGNEDDV